MAGYAKNDQGNESSEVLNKLLKNFAFEPTPSQSELLTALSKFLVSTKHNCLLLIKGYAGTGKTTMVNSLVKTLPSIKLKSVLLAPTGRAAKVLGNYSGVRAFTIHKKIYNKKADDAGFVKFSPADNLHTNTVFVVDEASMIGWEDFSSKQMGTVNLLKDLFEYVYSGKNCRLILIGDGAQLPPVHQDRSPALDLKFLKDQFNVTAAICELKDVLRQTLDSGILNLATQLRNTLFDTKRKVIKLQIPEEKDTERITGMELEEKLEWSFSNYSVENSIVITRSNKTANLFNRQVRARMLFREEELSSGDLIMIVKNNYYWLDEKSSAGFIANGDIAEILKVKGYEELYDNKFANAVIRLLDYPEEKDLEVKINLGAFDSNAAAMPADRYKLLYYSIAEDFEHIMTRTKKHQEILKSPYLNALQAKFAYAITCHKAQGGQWPVVFVDQGYLTEEMLDDNYLRWLYTAVSRATEKLFLVNFSDLLFEKEL